MLIVLDALQVPARFSGVGRQALSIGRALHRVPQDLELEVRCALDVRPLLEPVFPPRTRFRTPIGSSRPRSRRIAYQQLFAPRRDRGPMLLVALGDQGPVWGRVPVLLVVNDLRRLTEPSTSGGLEGSYYRFLTPRAARHAAHVVTISEFSRNEIRRAFGAGIDARVVADHPLPRVDRPIGGVESGPFVIVSALRRYKGMGTAIDALALLPAGSQRELVLVGTDDGWEGELRRHARARGVEHLVTFAGWLEDDCLRELYARCLASLSPSTYEGYGLPLAESLSYGLPAVASDIPPHREVAGEAALYFEPVSYTQHRAHETGA
jgi:glycosyltransferase involved in cell wall biosynthesis